MITRAILASALLAASISATAAAPEWTVLDGNNADYTFFDSASFVKRGQFVEVDVLRNFNEVITLGNDPDTGEAMYPHRSVKLTYKVDCDKGATAMRDWKMFGGSFGNGEVVWADKSWGKPAFNSANDDETRAVVRSTCATNTASR